MVVPIDARSSSPCTADWVEEFVPSRWWRGGWLQTISIKALRPELEIETRPGTVPISVSDGQTPADELKGYFLPAESPSQRRPTVVVFHGMGGHAKSGYMRSMASHLLGRGYPVILWNHRGAGDSAESCRRLHHPGRASDVALLVHHLNSQRPQWLSFGLAAVGFSLGANVLLRYLAETGENSGIVAAATISAPLDLKLTSTRLKQGWNKLFDRYLLMKQRQEILRSTADLSDEERTTIENVRTVWDLDDRFTANRFDCRDAESYYEQNSAVHVLEKIRTPTALFHAADDPVVDDAVFGQFSWRDEGPLFPVSVQTGGHTGFLQRDGRRWHERMTAKFFDWVIRRPKEASP